MKKDSKPKSWLNEQGQLFSDDELKIISRTWDKETWESYLKTIEFEEDTGIILNKPSTFLEEAPFGEWKDLLPDAKHLGEDLLNLLESLIHSLTPKYREIIVESYFLNTSEVELGKKFGVSKSTIKKIKKKSREQIKRGLLRHYPAFREIFENKGGVQTPYSSEGTICKNK